MRLRALALIAVGTAAFAPAAHAGTFTKHDGAEAMDDGTTITTSVYIPDGEPPTAGWPGVILVHGLGGSRKDTNQIAEQFFAPYGYAVLTYDIRGHGGSGGYVTFAGPREIADLRAARARLRRSARTSTTTRSAAGGFPTGPASSGRPPRRASRSRRSTSSQTWTDLFSALYCERRPEVGLIAGLLGESPARPPLARSRLARVTEPRPDPGLRRPALGRRRDPHVAGSRC